MLILVWSPLLRLCVCEEFPLLPNDPTQVYEARGCRCRILAPFSHPPRAYPSSNVISARLSTTRALSQIRLVWVRSSFIAQCHLLPTFYHRPVASCLISGAGRRLQCRQALSTYLIAVSAESHSCPSRSVFSFVPCCFALFPSARVVVLVIPESLLVHSPPPSCRITRRRSRRYRGHL